MTMRVFAVLAAIFLVAAVALGSMLPADEPVSQILAELDIGSLPHLQAFELQHFGGWAWRVLTVPLLRRPIWFAPFALGLICVGAATSLNWMKAATPRRRRS